MYDKVIPADMMDDFVGWGGGREVTQSHILTLIEWYFFKGE